MGHVSNIRKPNFRFSISAFCIWNFQNQPKYGFLKLYYHWPLFDLDLKKILGHKLKQNLKPKTKFGSGALKPNKAKNWLTDWTFWVNCDLEIMVLKLHA